MIRIGIPCRGQRAEGNCVTYTDNSKHFTLGRLWRRRFYAHATVAPMILGWDRTARQNDFFFFFSHYSLPVFSTTGLLSSSITICAYVPGPFVSPTDDRATRGETSGCASFGTLQCRHPQHQIEHDERGLETPARGLEDATTISVYPPPRVDGTHLYPGSTSSAELSDPRLIFDLYSARLAPPSLSLPRLVAGSCLLLDHIYDRPRVSRRAMSFVVSSWPFCGIFVLILRDVTSDYPFQTSSRGATLLQNVCSLTVPFDKCILETRPLNIHM